MRVFSYYVNANCVVCCGIGFMLIFCARTVGQKTTDLQPWKVAVAPSVNLSSVQDKLFSSLYYSGTNLGVAANLAYDREKSLQRISGFYKRGKASSGIGESTPMSFVYARIGYDFLYKIMRGESRPFKVNAGAGLRVLKSNRTYKHFINTSTAEDFAASLCASIDLIYAFNGGFQGFSISNEFCIPLLSFINDPAKRKNAETLSSLKATGFSSFICLQNQLIISKEFLQRHKLALVYALDYYQIKKYREVKQKNSQIALSYGYKF
jgi:hypothetical protein